VKWPYNNYRPHQEEIVGKIIDALNRNVFVALNAPTGYGKTVAVLYSVLKYILENRDIKCLYIVRTRNEMAPVIRELYNIYSKENFFKYIFLMNKRDMCFHSPVIEERIGYEDFLELCREMRKKNLCPLKKLSFKPFEKISEYIEYAILNETCPWEAAKELTYEANIIVGTYPYLFNPYINKILFENNILNPSKTILVIDEAHNIDYMCRHSDKGLSRRTIDIGFREIDMYGSSLKDHEREFILNILNKIKEIFEKLPGEDKYRYYGLEKFYNEIAVDIDLSLFDEISDKVMLEKMSKIGLKGRCFIKSIYRFIMYLVNIYKNFPRDFELFSIKNRLEIKNINPQIVLSKINAYKNTIFLSGTLPPPDYIRDMFQITGDLEYIRIKDIFGRENKRYICAVDVSTKYKERNIKLYVKMAIYLIYFRRRIPEDKIILAVYPSYDLMKKILSVYEDIKDKINIDITDIVEDENLSIDEAAEQASKGRNIIIHAVAGGKMTEGIEITRNGRSLIVSVVVVGLPFPEPNDYMDYKYRRILEIFGKRKVWNYSILIPTLIKVKQAFGRTIRSRGDKALLVVLDRRALHSNIRDFLEADFNKIALPSNVFERLGIKT